MDEKKYVDLLIAAGKNKKEATEFVKKVITAIQAAMPNASTETQDAVVMLKLDDILHGSNGDPFTGICIGMSDIEDSSRYLKDKAIEAFKADSNQAIMKGQVKMDDNGKPIPLDTREYLDKAQTKKNNNFGKPLPTQLRRQMVFIVDGKIIRAFGKEDPEIGKAYDFKATVSESGFFSIAKDSLKESATQLSAADLWGAVYSASGQSEFVTALCDVKSADKNSFIVTKGYVKHIAETSNGGAMIVLIDGDCEEGVVGFSGSSETKELILHGTTMGEEVISIGRVTRQKDDRFNISTLGIIINPASDAVVSGLDALKDISI